MQVPADAITASIPVYRFGLKVGQMAIHVRAAYDQAAGGRHSLFADVWAEDEIGNHFALPQSLVPSILDEIAEHDRGAWAEIEAASGQFEQAA